MMNGWKCTAGSLIVLAASMTACSDGSHATNAVVPQDANCGSTSVDRIDARCYATLQAAVDAAMASATPLWLPAATYAITQPLVIDYTPMAGTGFQIISDGAVIDATSILDSQGLRIQCSGGSSMAPKACFYFHIQGTLFVNGNTTATLVRFGNNDFSDAHNSAKVDHLVINNSGPGMAVRLNYVLNADLSIYAVTTGGYGMQLNQVQFSRINGAASATNGTALAIMNGYTFANTFQGLDLEVAQTCLAITSPYANRNTFVSPYFNCNVPVVATAGNQNVLLNASYGASQPPNPGTLTGVVSLP